MKRPWQVWLVFVVCVSGAAAAMGWLTRQALETDAQRRTAQANADLEQRVSLALWRMDTELAPIIAAEVIRAPSMYRSAFLAADANGPFQQPIQAPNQAAVAQDAVFPAAVNRQPSPLLVEPPAYVVCNFECSPGGVWRSPQVPESQLKALATMNGVSPESLAKSEACLAELATEVNMPELLAQLPSATLPSLAAAGDNNLALANAESVLQVSQVNKGLNYYSGNGVTPPTAAQDEMLFSPIADEPPLRKDNSAPIKQSISKLEDYSERNRRYQSMAQQGFLEQRQNAWNNSATIASDQSEMIGVSRPVWVGERLLLARRVVHGAATFVQGSWLDWPKLKTRLLAEAVQLVPQADLVPVRGDVAADPGRMLAGLPVRLIVDSTPLAETTFSPTLRWALWVGWGAFVLAAAAAAALLGGVMTLSERRASFVSSVTHELRTPLTTFRMYAEMLARGMVPDASRRQEYLHTLERESERLSHLVENVLAYARLERGRRPQVADLITPQALLDRVGTRLAHRAEQANMRCEIEIDPGAEDISFTTDQNVVEQVLFNLVDNAAKYARAAANRQIHVTAGRNDRYVSFTVRDHGPGIQPRYQGRIRPFDKTAEESAETAPGVGLGLALCRRLARQLGGRLEIAPAQGGGARVTLYLPA
jgi:signal transduction histidine kinase